MNHPRNILILSEMLAVLHAADGHKVKAYIFMEWEKKNSLIKSVFSIYWVNWPIFAFSDSYLYNWDTSKTYLTTNTNLNRICSVMVPCIEYVRSRVIDLHGRRKTKNYKISFCWFSALRAVSRRKRKHWLVRNKANASDWSTIKMKLCDLIWYKAESSSFRQM